MRYADAKSATHCCAQLMFAFGFARLGDCETADRLRLDAAITLGQVEANREFYRLAELGYQYRISEALRGEAHSGTLADRCREVVDAMLLDDKKTSSRTPEGMTAYLVARLVQSSRILEPERAYNPYARIIKMDPAGVESFDWRPRLADVSQPIYSTLTSVRSAQELWEAIRSPSEYHLRPLNHGSGHSTHLAYVRQLSKTLEVLGDHPVSLIDRVGRIVAAELPVVPNCYATAPYISRLHLELIDPLVLAIAGTGPLIVGEEREPRLELLHHVRRPVLSWIDAMP